MGDLFIKKNMQSSASYILSWKAQIYGKVYYYFLLKHIFLDVICLPSSVTLTREAVKSVAVLHPSELDMTRSLGALSNHCAWGFCQPSELIQMMYYCLLWVPKPAISHAVAKI